MLEFGEGENPIVQSTTHRALFFPSWEYGLGEELDETTDLHVVLALGGLIRNMRILVKDR